MEGGNGNGNASSNGNGSSAPNTSFTKWHAAVLVACGVVFAAFSSPMLSYFDEDTMRPNSLFPAQVKAVARATNVPIKLGLFHMTLYAFEFWLDRELFPRHIGQRFTTLWYQLLQPERYGQHLQMHVETLMQLCDAESRANALGYPAPAVAAMYMAGSIVMLQNALTSMGWHSAQEQAIGFALALLKLAFDYSALGAELNRTVGSALSDVMRWVGVALMLFGGYVVNGFESLHPTTIATLIFAGGAVVAVALLAFELRAGGRWRSFAGGAVATTSN